MRISEYHRKGAAAIGLRAMLAESERHSSRCLDDLSDMAELDAQTGEAVSIKRKTPWKKGGFRFGQGREQ